MEHHNASSPQWTSKGLLELLRASLPPARKVPGRPAEEANPPPPRLDSRQLTETANAWRRRSAEGDEGAESVAAALEYLATRRRSQDKRARIQAMGKRLSQLMQLS
ncbi:hypothetical protein J7E62_01160 [Variovorax paradoxus]|nr:hypothetical protein [Variovorax paradoxus]